MRNPPRIIVYLCAIVSLNSVDTIRADIDLRWSPQQQTLAVGQTIEIDLLAVSDNGSPQSIAAMDVVFTWDPQRLRFQGVEHTSPYPWLSLRFEHDDLDGLNESLDDGDAKLTALSNFTELAYATDEGLRVTTLVFVALDTVDPTSIVIEERLGQYSRTAVYGGEAPNDDRTGSLGIASARIVAPADCDGDGGVDLREFGRFQACLNHANEDDSTNSEQDGSCCRVFDGNDDGQIDLTDYPNFQDRVTGPISQD